VVFFFGLFGFSFFLSFSNPKHTKMFV